MEDQPSSQEQTPLDAARKILGKKKSRSQRQDPWKRVVQDATTPPHCDIQECYRVVSVLQLHFFPFLNKSVYCNYSVLSGCVLLIL